MLLCEDRSVVCSKSLFIALKHVSSLDCMSAQLCDTEESPWLMSLGMLLISPLTIFWCSCLMLKGSTVKGNVPVSIANVLTPLHPHVRKTCANKSTFTSRLHRNNSFETSRITFRWDGTASLTLTTHPLWVRTSCERVTRGLRRQDSHTGCSAAPGTRIQASACCSGQSLCET